MFPDFIIILIYDPNESSPIPKHSSFIPGHCHGSSRPLGYPQYPAAWWKSPLSWWPPPAAARWWWSGWRPRAPASRRGPRSPRPWPPWSLPCRARRPGRCDGCGSPHLRMDGMDGWRLYGMSMIFHVFLGVFFRDNVGGWWGVWKVFFLWFGNWGFSHTKRHVFLGTGRAKVGELMLAQISWWSYVMLSSHWWQFQIVGPAHTVWQSEGHLCKHHAISKFILYIPSLVIKNGKLQNHRTKWTFIAGYSWENTI